MLAAEGFDVEVPRLPRCCGALQLHAGDAAARALAMATIEALEGFDDDRGQLGRLRLGDEGLRARAERRARMGGARRALRREGARRDRAARGGRAARAARPPAHAPGLPRRLSPGARAGRSRPAAGAAARDPGARARSSPRTGRSAAARQGSTTCSSRSRRPSWAAARRTACWPRAPRRWRRPIRAARSRSPHTRGAAAPGCPCTTRWSCSRARSPRRNRDARFREG